MKLPSKPTIHVLGYKGFIGSSLTIKFDVAESRLIRHGSLESFQSWCSLASTQEILSSHAIWAIGKISPYLAETQPDLVKQELETFSTFLKLNRDFRFKLLLLSSGGCVYSGNTGHGATEKSVAEGVNNYGRAKVVMEEMFLSSKLPGNILRLGNVYGKSAVPRKGQGVIGHWVADLRLGNSVKVYGDINLKRDYIHISDVCDAVQVALFLDVDHEVYNIGTGVGTDLRQLLSLIEEALNVKARPELLPGRPEDDFSYFLDSEKYFLETGWRARISLFDGLSEYSRNDK